MGFLYLFFACSLITLPPQTHARPHLLNTSQPHWTLSFVSPLRFLSSVASLSRHQNDSLGGEMGAGGSGAERLKGLDRILSGEDPWPAQGKSWKQHA